jgi:hypothetical protein
VSKKCLEDRERRMLGRFRCGGRSGSALACRGSGVSVEFSGDQTSPVFVRLAIAQLGLEVQADEGMKNVAGRRC